MLSVLACSFLVQPAIAKAKETDSAKSSTTASAASSAPAGAKTSLPKVYDFSAVWCLPCKKFAPIFDKVSQNYKGKVEFTHFDVDSKEGKPMADKYGVLALPAVLFLNAKGKVVLKNEKIMTEEELIKNTDALLK